MELLRLRSQDLPWLANTLHEQLSKHAQWTSPMIQNELLCLIADQERHIIFCDVQESEIFAIILDETSDISRTKLVALCLYYISEGTNKETFVVFYKTNSTEWLVWYELLKKAIGE